MDPIHYVYVDATLAMLNCVVEPTLLGFMERLLVPLTFPALEKLARIISLKISQVYLRTLFDVANLEDTGAVLMAVQAVEDAFEYLEDMRHAIIWSTLTNPQSSFLFMIHDRTFDDFMDGYLFVLGQRMGQGEFAAMEPPLPDLEGMVFRLLLQRNLQYQVPNGNAEERKHWLRRSLVESAAMYVRQRADLQTERDTMHIDIEYAQNRFRTGDFADEVDREGCEIWLDFLLGMLPNHSLEPKPYATTIQWFEDLDWVELENLSNDQVDKVRADLLAVSVFNRGLEREAALRRGVTVPLEWKPDCAW